MDDEQLVREYAQGRSEPAFAELVRRHLPMVYAAARRQVRDEHLAQDVSQAVFLVLAERAKRLPRVRSLGAWLYRVTWYAATRARAANDRRRRHEQQAAQESSAMRSEEISQVWSEVEPTLDAALNRLSSKDREAIVLRYFEDRSIKEVAEALGLGESATKMRLARALEKLRGMLEGGEGMLSVPALTAVLEAKAIVPAPVGLVGSVTAGALTGAAGATGQASLIAKGAMKMMAYVKVKVAVVVLLAAGAGAGVIAEVGVSSQAEHAEHPRSTATQLVPAPSLDAGSVQKLMMAMSQKERMDYLIRALKQRETELQHVSLSFTEFVGNMRTPDARADKYFRSSIQTEVTIDGPRRLIRSKEFNDDNVLLKDSLISYNGARRRSLDNYHVVEIKNFRVVTHPCPGNIVDDPESQATRSQFYHMLGNQVINGHRTVEGRVVFVAMPISEALSQLPWDVQLSQEEGVPVVTASFKKTGGEMVWDYVWTFDLSRNWMPKRYIDRTIAGPAKTYALYEVTEARNVDGLFLPWKMIYRGSVDRYGGKTSGDMSVEVTAAARGRRLDDGFEVVFPPGTIVADGVAGVGYRMREDGGADQLSNDEFAAALGHAPGTVTVSRQKQGPGSDKIK